MYNHTFNIYSDTTVVPLLQAHFNSIAILDADGACLGVYRKSHIPTGPGYQEKLYFNPVRIPSHSHLSFMRALLLLVHALVSSSFSDTG